MLRAGDSLPSVMFLMSCTLRQMTQPHLQISGSWRLFLCQRQAVLSKMAQINHLSGHTGSQGALPKTNSRGWCWGSNSALLLLGMCSTTELDPQPPRASLRRYISTSLGLGERQFGRDSGARLANYRFSYASSPPRRGRAKYYGISSNYPSCCFSIY